MSRSVAFPGFKSIIRVMNPFSTRFFFGSLAFNCFFFFLSKAFTFLLSFFSSFLFLFLSNMFCSITGEAPHDAVVHIKTGHLYERSSFSFISSSIPLILSPSFSFFSFSSHLKSHNLGGMWRSSSKRRANVPSLEFHSLRKIFFLSKVSFFLSSFYPLNSVFFFLANSVITPRPISTTSIPNMLTIFQVTPFLSSFLSSFALSSLFISFSFYFTSISINYFYLLLLLLHLHLHLLLSLLLLLLLPPSSSSFSSSFSCLSLERVG